MARVTVGTRGSALALAQANWVADRLRAAHQDLDVCVQIIQTEGDRTQAANIPLSTFGEKGVFAKEIEAALLAGAVDLAVHSMKDLAPVLPEGLHIAAVPEREDPRDAVIGANLADLPAGARVGTGSVRRTALLQSLRPDLDIQSIRGNVDTRIRKLREGQYDVILLAVAGLNRLGRHDEIAEILDPQGFVPDPGQGALAIQTRVGDDTTNALVAALDHPPSHIAVRAERAYLKALGAGCQTPVGAWARLIDGQLVLTALLALPDGSIKRETLAGAPEEAEELGRKIAETLACA
ncbi:MAG TPA: hydroxymethylbilane synthase [Capsulimonadaceae bacterium]|nr:hydroxymethylbilane synthase [Capsulimonadaceae bacterium]